MGITASDLKRLVEEYDPSSHFFDRSSMGFFGDTMRNYGVRAQTVTFTTSSGVEHECWELYRKRPVKNGMKKSAYFDIHNMKRVIKPTD